MRPFWFDLPASFYARVNKAAEEFGMTRKELVSKAVNHYIKNQRLEKRNLILPTTPVQEELVKEFQRKAGSLRWQGVSAEERKEIMGKIAEARWGTKRKTPKKN